jgi:hypothetical protein
VPPEGDMFLKGFKYIQHDHNMGSEVVLLKLNITLGVQRFEKCFEDESVNYS